MSEPVTGSVGEEDADHGRPAGVDDATVEAVGKLTEAVEWLERARGCLYELHQTIGHLDEQMGEAASMLGRAGHRDAAELVDGEIVGRNVLDGRWTFQVVEEFDDHYYEPIKAIERCLRDELMAGRRHVYESELKERRRSRGTPGHERRPAATHDG